MKVTFCTTCKGRADHVKRTLPRNLADNPDGRFLLLDYASHDGLAEWLAGNCACELANGRLAVYYYPAPGAFHTAHAKNMAARLGVVEGADILVTLDADNFAGTDFSAYAARELQRYPGSFLRPEMVRIEGQRHVVGTYGQLFPHKRGVAGRLAIRAQDFMKAGGYDEKYSTWQGEDMDLNARLTRIGYTARGIDPSYLDAVLHGADVRFKEWPEARKYENDDVLREINGADHTLANYGVFGCGTAYKNYKAPVELCPLPTRLFGIGLHKTATTSLHAAFQRLGYDSLHWGQGEAPKVWNELLQHGASKTLERYYCASDLPIPLLYKQLDLAYPGSKFILTVRNEVKWLKSVEGLYDPNRNPTRWTWDAYPITNTLHRALYGRADFDAPTMLACYRRHNAEVRDYFKSRPQDLLVMDMDGGAGWLELCGFLECSRPSEPYPREYVTR